MNNKKQFIIWGSSNAITFVEVLNWYLNKKLYLGYIRLKSSKFKDIEGNFKGIPVTVYTTIDNGIDSSNELQLERKYNKEEYKRYDNCDEDIINVDRIKDIPVDYEGLIGVPISYLAHPDKRFEVVGESKDFAKVVRVNGILRTGRFYLDGKRKYARLVIKRI